MASVAARPEAARQAPAHECTGAGVDQPPGRGRSRSLPDAADHEQHAAAERGIPLLGALQRPAAPRRRTERARLRGEGRDDARHIQCAVPALVSVRYAPSAHSGKKAQYP